ncbi:MAG: glycosyltransferase [Bacteroidota bacterium]
MSGGITTTIIIPTYNGAHKVVNALQSVEKQSCPPDEILVVIDGSTDDTKSIIEQRKFDLPQLRIIEQANEGRAGVRNRGALEAAKNLLIFMDDDMVVPEDWVKCHQQHHLKFPGSFVSGRLDQMHSDGHLTEFGKFENWQNGRWNKDIRSSELGEVQLNNPYITANNFSVSKQDFMDMGMFDARLKDAEDYDLAVRARLRDKSIFLSNQCWAWHNDFSAKTFTSYLKRLREYTNAQWELIRLKPELYGNPEINERYPTVPTGLKCTFFKLFVNRFMINSMDNHFWTFLPVNLRCKLYDFILTANGNYFPTVKI